MGLPRGGADPEPRSCRRPDAVSAGNDDRQAAAQAARPDDRWLTMRAARVRTHAHPCGWTARDYAAFVYRVPRREPVRLSFLSLTQAVRRCDSVPGATPGTI